MIWHLPCSAARSAQVKGAWWANVCFWQRAVKACARRTVDNKIDRIVVNGAVDSIQCESVRIYTLPDVQFL